ncbi:c-type cytochrome [Sinisalibacter aestuarii]|uniref:Cytochrome c domain-containing protein n=1 Tax=Sinisalibacter aestuarii TaxID=2949426 RepID=A0ABQ5LT28_9RHOB|nr:cytochrome C [Sinisalibacter aestuarii]GKY87898.1 hypothetical protein STA1M1_17670 [Sinisalibacter aestuarii]
MKKIIFSAIGAVTLAAPAVAADPTAGEADFKRCKACHAITAEDGTNIVKGGKTGPDLFGVIGRPVGSVEGFRYGGGLEAAHEAGLIWDEENLAVYITDPSAWLKEVLADPGAKSNMTYKHKKGAEDIAAYLASLGS